MAMAAETPHTMKEGLLPATPTQNPSAPETYQLSFPQELSASIREKAQGDRMSHQQEPRMSFQQEPRMSFQQEPSVSIKERVQGERVSYAPDSFSQAQAVVEHEDPEMILDPLDKVPAPLRGTAYFCKQFGKRVWQILLYFAFVVPPSIVVGILCSSLLYCIKIVTAIRNGQCSTWPESPHDDHPTEHLYYWRLLDTESPLVSCTEIEGANRWLLYLLSFSGLFVASLYTFLGNANASGGMNTILNQIRKLEEEINRMVEDTEEQEANGRPLPRSRTQQCEQFKGLVNLRMCPLVFVGTVSTHLCGGAAGREGSALQMAAAVFSKYCDFLDATLGRLHPSFRLTMQMRRAALVAAIAVGFSGIFGVPVTGAIFAVEVLKVGELTVGEMLIPAVLGSFFADWSCRLMSIHVYNFESHSQYTCEECQAAGVPQNWLMPSWEAGVEILAVIPAAFAFGMCGYAFEWLLHHFKDIFGKLAGKASFGNAKAKALLTPFIGGWFVVLLWFGLNVFDSLPSFNFKQDYNGTDAESSTFAQAYLGLSVYEPGMSISSCFLPQGNHTWQKGPNVNTPVQRIQWYSFLLKLLFTTLTLGAGFKGGEVTPIFFIGAALGNVCGQAMKQDTQLFSGLGLVAVFGACANTPIAVTFMGIELFGGAKAFPFLVANFIAYIVSNTEHVNGIYGAQDKPRGGVVTVTPFSRSAPHHV